MDHKSKYFQSLGQMDYTSSELMTTECSIRLLENLTVFKQNPRLLIRLRMVLENENVYEAHQLYKTIHFRCVCNNLFEDCLVLLTNGIVYFTLKKSLHCAFDLSKVFVESLKKLERKSLDNDLKRKIKIIHGMLRNGGEERNEFTVAVLKWSGGLFVKSKLDMSSQANINENYQKTFGHFDLHREFALNFWMEKNYVQARYHFLHSLDTGSFAHMIIECHMNFGLRSEYDLFLIQSVLQILTLRNRPAAIEFFKTYTENHPFVSKKKTLDSKLDVFDEPLINLTNLVILSTQIGSPKVFKSLLDIYKPTIERDTSLNTYLERIGEYYFNIKKSRREPEGGLFGNLMRMLTSSGDSSESGGANTSTHGAHGMFGFSQDDDGSDANENAGLEDDDALD